MSIPAIGPVSGTGGVSGVTPTGYLSGPEADRAAGGGGSEGVFAAVLGQVDHLTQLQATSNALAVRAVTGDLDDVHDYTVAAAEAKTTLELTAAVRNKAIDAFTEVMRMQA